MKFRGFFPDGGRHATKTRKESSQDINFLKRLQCISLLLEVYGWIKRSLKIVGVLGNPRNINKYLLVNQGRFALLHFNAEVFYILNAFSTVAPKS